MNFYKIVCIATSVLFIVLCLLLLFGSTSFVKDMGLEPSVATSVLAKRASMFMLGLSILLFCSRNLPHTNSRQFICLSTGVTMLGLACMGSYEHFMGTVNSSIITAVVIETILGLSFLAIFFKNRTVKNIQ